MAQGICQSNDLSYNDFGKGNELDNEQSQFEVITSFYFNHLIEGESSSRK